MNQKFIENIENLLILKHEKFETYTEKKCAIFIIPQLNSNGNNDEKPKVFGWKRFYNRLSKMNTVCVYTVCFHMCVCEMRYLNPQCGGW